MIDDDLALIQAQRNKQAAERAVLPDEILAIIDCLPVAPREYLTSALANLFFCDHTTSEWPFALGALNGQITAAFLRDEISDLQFDVLSAFPQTVQPLSALDT